MWLSKLRERSQLLPDLPSFGHEVKIHQNQPHITRHYQVSGAARVEAWDGLDITSAEIERNDEAPLLTESKSNQKQRKVVWKKGKGNFVNSYFSPLSLSLEFKLGRRGKSLLCSGRVAWARLRAVTYLQDPCLGFWVVLALQSASKVFPRIQDCHPSLSAEAAAGMILCCNQSTRCSHTPHLGVHYQREAVADDLILICILFCQENKWKKKIFWVVKIWIGKIDLDLDNRVCGSLLPS